MKAIMIIDGGAGRSLAIGDLPEPVPGPHELLVRVHSAGFNRAELALTQSHYSSPSGAPVVAGSEMSGTIVAVGERCDGFSPGDRVMGLCKGSFAEQVLIACALAIRVPEAIDLATAAALPGWYMTAHNALTSEGGMQPGATVLVQGATSGVGIAVAQIARMLGAGKIIGVSRTLEKLNRLCGVYDVTIATEGDWPSRVLADTDGRGADLVIDLVGGGTLDGNMACAKLAGRIVAVGRMGGDKDCLDLNMLALKRLTLVGVTFRTRSVEEKARIAVAFERDILPAIVDGRLAPLLGSSFPLEAASVAQHHVRHTTELGKTLLRIGA